MRGVSLTILKTEGRDDPIVHIYGKPAEVAVVAVMGQALVAYANRSEKARDAVVAMCASILEDDADRRAMFDDSDSEGGSSE